MKRLGEILPIEGQTLPELGGEPAYQLPPPATFLRLLITSFVTIPCLWLSLIYCPTTGNSAVDLVIATVLGIVWLLVGNFLGFRVGQYYLYASMCITNSLMLSGFLEAHEGAEEEYLRFATWVQADPERFVALCEGHRVGGPPDSYELPADVSEHLAFLQQLDEDTSNE